MGMVMAGIMARVMPQKRDTTTYHQDDLEQVVSIVDRAVNQVGAIVTGTTFKPWGKPVQFHGACLDALDDMERILPLRMMKSGTTSPVPSRSQPPANVCPSTTWQHPERMGCRSVFDQHLFQFGGVLM